MEPGEAARQQADQAAAMQQTDNADAAETTAQKDAASAVRSENPAVQQLAAALQADNLTGKTINLFTPNAANEANRAAFAEEYGMELPDTASETRKALRTLAQQSGTMRRGQRTLPLIRARVPWKRPGKPWKAGRATA